jgi:hypothetical protein
VVLTGSLFYLQEGGDIRLPPEAGAALSSIREDGGVWLSRTASSISRDGSYFGDLLRSPSRSRGYGSHIGEEPDQGGSLDLQDGSHEVYDETTYSPSIYPILEFNSSVSRSLFRTWGSLTLQGGSTLQYLILNASLWDGDRLVENTRYMMMDLEPGKSRDFDIREICSLNPDLGYSSLLVVEVPEGLFRPERRDCIVAEDGQDVVIPGSSRYSSRNFYSREAAPEMRSMDPPRLSEPADDATLSSKSTSSYQETPAYRDTSTYEETSAYKETSEYEETSTYQEGTAHREASTSSELWDSAGDIEYLYVGSKNSDKYHLPDCTSAKKIKKENRVYFLDVWEAREAGYSPCKACNPE